MSQSRSQDKLGTMPIGRLLVSMSVPMMISMFIQALYNIVDSIFVARICEDALTAVGLAMPVQSIMNAVAVGTGVGVNALVSRSLGEGNTLRAEKAANVQILLCLCYTAVSVTAGLTLPYAFYRAQTDVLPIIDYGCQYLSIVCIFSLGLYMSQGFEKLLVATGNSTRSMISQALGAVLNIFLDPVFIFGWGPVPAMGVRGAAVATVIGQFAAAICALAFNLYSNKAVRLNLRKIIPDIPILKFIYSVGLPSMITIGLNSVLGFAMNSIFLSFSTTAAAVFGVWLKLQGFGFMPVFGMNNGTIAIYSYNHGAGRGDRVVKTFRLAMMAGVGITAAVTLLYELIPVPLMRLFNASDYMLGIGVTAVRLTALSLSLGAGCVIISSACQSLGKARYTLLINVCRQMLFQIVIAALLAKTGRLELVWLSPLIAEALALVLAIYLAKKVFKPLSGEKRNRN